MTSSPPADAEAAGAPLPDEPGPAGARPQPAARPLLARKGAAFLVSFALCSGLALTWAAATPMFGVPDEISHMIRAAAAARGDLDGRPVEGQSDHSYLAPAVLEPGATVQGPSGLCYAFVSKQPASCLTFTGDRGDKQLLSTATSYPPVYYLLVGWPSRFTEGVASLYAMRAASALLFGALLALATVSLGTGRRWATGYAGLAVAATPMVWFVGASVNPSSAAVAAGIAAWCGGYRLVADDVGRVPLSRSAWRFGLPLCLLLLVRRDSFVWAGLLVLALVALVSRRRAAELVRSPAVWAWGAAAAVCVVFAASSGIDQGSQTLGAAASGSATLALGYAFTYVMQMIGVLGWLDTYLPWPAYALWLIVFGALFLAALGFARRRVAAVAVLVLVALFATIVVFGARRFPYFQGRYGLPFAVGAPLLAGFGLATDRLSGRLPRRPIVVVLVLAGAIQFLAYYQQFRRYAISGEATWWLFSDVRWRPPTAPIPVLLALNLAMLVLVLGWWFVRSGGAAAPRQAVLGTE